MDIGDLYSSVWCETIVAHAIDAALVVGCSKNAGLDRKRHAEEGCMMD